MAGRRPRLTVRRLMAYVAAAAVVVALFQAIAWRVAWMQNSRHALNLITVGVDRLSVRRPGRHGWTGEVAGVSFEASRPLLVEFDYILGSAPRTPRGIPYLATLSIQVFDRTAPTTPVVRREQSALMVTGLAPWDRARGRARFLLIPPRAGEFGLQYDLEVMDWRGRRTGMGRYARGIVVR